MLFDFSQLKNEQKFEQGVGFVSLDQIGSGSITLKEFEKKKKQVESVCELKIKGLNQQEAFSLVTSNGSSKANPEVKNALQQYLTPQLQSESEKPGNQKYVNSIVFYSISLQQLNGSPEQLCK